MLHPTVISPEELVPAGGELDALKKVVCICQQTRMLGAVKLVWANFGDGWGYRACCGQQCFTAAFKEGEA